MATITVQPPSVGWRFWVFWMLATIAGGIAYLFAAIPINALMMNLHWMNAGPVADDQRVLVFLAVFVVSGLMGAFFGAAQWLVLRKYLLGSGWWVLAAFLGYGLPLSMGMLDLMPRGEEARVAGPVILILEFGLTLGVLQWLVLRRYVRRAGWWIPITIAGWALAFLLIGVAYVTGIYVEPFDMLAAFLVPVAVAGAALVWLLRDRQPVVESRV